MNGDPTGYWLDCIYVYMYILYACCFCMYVCMYIYGRRVAHFKVMYVACMYKCNVCVHVLMILKTCSMLSSPVAT